MGLVLALLVGLVFAVLVFRSLNRRDEPFGGPGAGAALLFFVLVVAGASSARAACPAQPAGPINSAADGTIRLCAPELSAAGTPHAPGELATCTVTATWPGAPTPAPTVTISAPTAGSTYPARFSGARGDGSATGVCANSRGETGQPVSVAVRWPLGTPGAPVLTP